jgi:hypothetical protein
MKKMFGLALTAATAIIFLLSSCGGGFGVDCDNAKDVGPGIFVPDSIR